MLLRDDRMCRWNGGDEVMEISLRFPEFELCMDGMGIGYAFGLVWCVCMYG